MKLNAPTNLVFLISLILFVLGLLGTFVAIPFITGYAFWFVVAAFVVLALACILKGL